MAGGIGHLLVERARHLSANRIRTTARLHFNRCVFQTRNFTAARKLRRHAALCEESLQLALDDFAYAVAVARIKPVQHQFFDGNLYPAAFHTQPLVSVSVKGFSSLRYSWRAARRMCVMRTGSPASAAKNVALSAMLRILPPATLSCASLRASNPSVGVSAGKMR